MLGVSSTTDWISALSAAVLGGLGLLFTAYQWWAAGFRPQLEALLGESGDSLRVAVYNRGRGPGLIHHVAVTNLRGDAVAGAFRGFADDEYRPCSVPPRARLELTIEAPDKEKYTMDNRVVIAWSNRSKVLTPVHVDVSFFGLDPFLPLPAGG